MRSITRSFRVFRYPILATIFLSCCAIPNPSAAQDIPRIVRLENNPAITPDMLQGDDGGNINGPSLIRVPDWVVNPLGRYYLYFAHHAGKYIRLAYSDSITGPWIVVDEGSLRLEQTHCIQDTHIASPDVHVDNERKQIVMYYHCPADVPASETGRQRTLGATSSDGRSFEAQSEALGNSYFRVFEWGEHTYALGMPGIFYRSDSSLSGFERGPQLFTEDMRHSAVTVRENILFVFYTDVGDDPERILVSMIDLSTDWESWKESSSAVVLEPEKDWEGGLMPAEPSVRGYARSFVRELRDPALFEEEGRTYLLYAVGGESGIAIAQIVWE